jgi:hypothetical protein
MQQAMRAAQGGRGGESLGVQDAVAASGSPVRGNAIDAKDEQSRQAYEPQREEREPLHHAETNDRAMAGPSASDDQHGPAPVKSPEHQQHRGEGDLARRL